MLSQHFIRAAVCLVTVVVAASAFISPAHRHRHSGGEHAHTHSARPHSHGGIRHTHAHGHSHAHDHSGGIQRRASADSGSPDGSLEHPAELGTHRDTHAHMHVVIFGFAFTLPDIFGDAVPLPEENSRAARPRAAGVRLVELYAPLAQPTLIQLVMQIKCVAPQRAPALSEACPASWSHISTRLIAGCNRPAPPVPPPKSA